MNFSKYFFLIILLYSIGVSCSSAGKIKIDRSDKNSLNKAVRLAIKDYSTRDLKSRDSLGSFFIDIQPIDSRIYSFSISPKGITRYYSKENLTENDVKRLPSHYSIVDNNLYYWWNEGSEGKNEDIEIFEKFGFLVEDAEAYGLYMDGGIDERQKITYYYFCKDDLSVNKWLRSNKAKLYFKIPDDIECD
jgi:hypothetical protein